MGLELFLLQNKVSQVSMEVASYLDVSPLFFPAFYVDPGDMRTLGEGIRVGGNTFMGSMDICNLILHVNSSLKLDTEGMKVLFHECVHGYHAVNAARVPDVKSIQGTYNQKLALFVATEYLAAFATALYYQELKGGGANFHFKNGSKKIWFDEQQLQEYSGVLDQELESRIFLSYNLGNILGTGYIPDEGNIKFTFEKENISFRIAPCDEKLSFETLKKFLHLDFYTLGNKLIGPDSQVAKAFLGQKTYV